MRAVLSDLVKATGASVLAGGSCLESRSITGLARIDSRLVEPGDLFVAFSGEKQNGNDYHEAAIATGAACVVATAEVSSALMEAADAAGVLVLRAKDDNGEQFLLDLASWYRTCHPEWCVVGITGSVGKTTTKDMVATALSTACSVQKTYRNFNNLLGVPLTLLSADESTQALVVEMGMNHQHEIDILSRVARPNYAIITNIGTSHIGMLGSRELIARTKAEIVNGMEVFVGTESGIGSVPRAFAPHAQIAEPVVADNNSPLLILEADGDLSSFIVEEFAKPKAVACVAVADALEPIQSGSHPLDTTGAAASANTTSANNTTSGNNSTSANTFASMASEETWANVETTRETLKPQVWISELTLDAEGYPHFTVACSDGWSHAGSLAIPGKKVVQDLLYAIALVWKLGLDRAKALEALASMQPAIMRFELKRTQTGVRILDDSYNANPQSMAAALDTLHEMPTSGRRIAVLGEMGELGDEEAALHGYVGAYAAAKRLSLLVCIGNTLAKRMADAARDCGMPPKRIRHYTTVHEAAQALTPSLQPDDIVLVKASRFAGLDVFVKEVIAV